MNRFIKYFVRDELIFLFIGRQKMASMPSAGAAVATTTTASAPDAGKAEPAKGSGI